MSSVRKSSGPRGRLAQEAFASGGLAVADAILRAEAAAASARAVCHDAIAETRLTLFERFTAPGRDAETFAALYRLSERLIEMSLPNGPGGLAAIARSLCDVADLCAKQDAWDWTAVDVHLSALALVSSDAAMTASDLDALLDGLAKVRERVTRRVPS